ncbi:acetylornithine deacetylase [Thalassobius sp. MITS945101]|uniref:acetylornithine deacetylase n=1 Tax=Thalassobius sp. MITS945101 TaxID=3096994 RepID=UPI00399B0E69
MSPTPRSAADILSRLVQFDTVSHRSNLPLLDWVETYLAEHGITGRRIYDATGKKANLIVTIGPEDTPGYVLSGHVDVVPVSGQNWTVDPFGGAIEDGKVWGRGTSDMKGFVACVLAAVPKMLAHSLAKPLHLIFSHDEEIGCVGVRSAIADLDQWPVKPLGCFVGEPTNMAVILGHKGKRAERVHFTGLSAHSSLAPTAVNAVEYAARLAVFIADLGRNLAEGTAQDPLYDVTHTTAHVGVLNGGRQVNIVPDTAYLDFEFRTICSDNTAALVDQVRRYAHDVLEPQMQAVDPDATIRFETLSDTPGVDTPPEAPMAALAKSIAQRNDHAKVAFATEGGLFQSIGIPTVILGPGDIDRAHKADEFITLRELDSCMAALSNLIETCRT